MNTRSTTRIRLASAALALSLGTALATDTPVAMNGDVSDSSTSHESYPAVKAFDGDRATGTGRWLANRGVHMYVTYEFAEATAVNVVRVWNASNSAGGYDSAGRAPKNWTFEGSNDGANWTVLDTRTDETGWSTSGEMRECAFSNDAAYTYYKFDCTALNDEVSVSSENGVPKAQYLQIWELEFLYRTADAPVSVPDPVLLPNGALGFCVATSGNDANAGTEEAPLATLGAAIAAANAAIAGGADAIAIQVAAGTYTGSGYVLDGPITVSGAGRDSTVIDGNGGYRVFSLTSADAALKGLCVSNGVFTADGQTGAGIYMEAGLVEDCAIVSCGAFGPSLTYGGGIYASGGRVSRTVFTGNMVHTRYSGNLGYGSALYLSGGAVCENSLFTGNAAISCFDWSAEQRRGGVVHLTDAGTALVNCTVVENRLAHASGNNNNNYAGIVQKNYAKVVNCVAYGNEPDAAFVESSGDVYIGGDEWRNNWQNYVVNSAWGTALTVKEIQLESPVAVSQESFADYTGGDYTPAIGGALFDAGSDAQYATYATSANDIAGTTRSQGVAMDIGCYETFVGAEITLSASANSYGVLLGAASTFTAVATGGSGSYTYKWNFGDGSEEVVTASATVQHTYAAAGLYQAAVSVSDDGGATWAMTAEPASSVAVTPADLYVNAANANPVFPYDTPAKAAATFADAYGCLTNTLPATPDMAVVDGVTIHVAAGTYAGAGYVLAGGITVVGAGADATVIDGNGGYRVFSLLASGAALKNLCVSNGVFTVAEQTGAGIYMEAGLVEDCAITSCGSFSPSKTSGGGIYASGGRIRRTVFTGNKAHMRWSNDVGYGSALYLSGGAICENSLFTGNAAVPCPDFDADRRRGGVIHMTGDGTVLVNCTVVENRLADPAGYGNITTKFSGIVQLAKSRVGNCVAYGNIPDAEYAASNWDVYAGGDEWRNNWQNYIANSAWGTATAKESTPESPIDISESSFRNYAKANFAPKSDGVLVDAGTSWSDYLGYGALSETDLAGKPRLYGGNVDIGCYEVGADAATIISFR